MQISANTTGMSAGLFVTADMHARDHCVVVVKGTFQTDNLGSLTIAAEQRPMVECDEHYGEPEKSCIRYECDFVLEKTSTDVIVVGKAVAPGGRPVQQLMVRLEVQGRAKDAVVTGERRWVGAAGGLVASAPVPFVEMPLTFDRAFGGADDSRGADKVAIETRNLHGVGFHPHRGAREIEGMPLPNLERLQQPISSPRDRPEPIGFGSLGRNWKDRVKFAGTYDQRWMDEVCPFLPADFDSRYFQSAPEDQRHPLFTGGEVIRCVHMAAAQVVQYNIPTLRVPVQFGFVDRTVERTGVLDTVVLEPHLGLAMLVWRASVPLGKKLNLLQQIFVGPQPREQEDGIVGYRKGKPVFRGLAAAIRWRRKTRRGVR